MGHFHQMVVHDVGQMIGRQIVCRLIQHLVIDNTGVNGHIATDDVIHVHILAGRHLKTHDILSPGGQQSIHLLLAHGQGVTHGHTRGGIVLEILDFSTFGIELLRSVESQIGVPLVQQLLHIATVNVATLRLTVGTLVATETYAFIKFYAQPFERFDNVFLCTGNKTPRVGIFNAENQIAAMLTGKKIIVQRGTDTSDM